MDYESLDRISYEDEKIFLQSEKEDREKEHDLGKKREREKEEINSDSDSDENNIQKPCSARGSDRKQRNSGLEFSLYLDEATTADLYLQLISGVQKENFDDEIITKETTNENHNYLLNNDNDVKKHESCDNNDNENTKKAKIENNFPISVDKISSKKQKMMESLPTHTIFDVTENKNGTKSETEILSTERKNNSCSYNSKFLDKETHLRLFSMYEQCKGENLESLVLSENMLMLMGYPGCDGEEGTSCIFGFGLYVFF